jgi:hypothetical protein
MYADAVKPNLRDERAAAISASNFHPQPTRCPVAVDEELPRHLSLLRQASSPLGLPLRSHLSGAMRERFAQLQLANNVPQVPFRSPFITCTTLAQSLSSPHLAGVLQRLTKSKVALLGVALSKVSPLRSENLPWPPRLASSLLAREVLVSRAVIVPEGMIKSCSLIFRSFSPAGVLLRRSSPAGHPAECFSTGSVT